MKRLLAACLILSLAACAADPNEAVYNEHEVGKQSDIEYGVIKAVKNVKIQKENTSGIGAVTGAAATGAAGSTMGNGGGSFAMTVIGAALGGIVGDMAEQRLRDQVGVQYTIRKENGKTVTIVQHIDKDEAPLKPGQKVMIQTDGSYQKASARNREAQYQRVLPVD